VDETRIVSGVMPVGGPRPVARRFADLFERGVRIRAAGEARERPERLLRRYLPRHELRLFDTTYFVGDLRHDPSYEGKLRFFVAWVLPTRDSQVIYPRVFSKDYSLVWRAPSHFIRSARENWMGKGEVRTSVEGGWETTYSAEETTNLPFEIQPALDRLSREGHAAPPLDRRAVPLLLRRAPDDRIEPYEDFAGPRRRARRNARDLPHGGRPVAWFARANDPASLRFARGFEPDFRRVLDVARSRSGLYGGAIRKFRILSRNREIQYLFVAGPRHAWIVPPQALTTEITSYGVRTIDVIAAEDLCVPGYEYHFVDHSTRPPSLHSQIPEGFAGAPSSLDPARVDASAWTDRLAPIQRFRRLVLGRRSRAGR